MTRRCLEHLRRHTTHPYELIVIDNGSRDRTQKVLQAFASSLKRRSGPERFQRLCNDRNLGFAHAINQGAREARGRYLCWLNNDVVVFSHWLERLVAAAEDSKDIAAVGPCAHISWGAQASHGSSGLSLAQGSHFAEAWHLRHQGLRTEANYLWGFCLLVKRAAADRVGPLDEGLGLAGWEDIDFCLRLRQAGFRLAIVRDVFVRHDAHASFSANDLDLVQIESESLAKFKAKWGLSGLMPQERSPVPASP